MSEVGTSMRFGIFRAGGLQTLVVSVALVTVATPARAQRTILLESHAVPPTQLVRRMMDMITRSAGEGVLKGRALSSRLEQLYGRPCRPLDKARQAALLTRLNQAVQAVYRGEWTKAIAMLRGIRQALGSDVLSTSRQRHVFQALQQARLMLANSYLRTARHKLAWAMMEEALRAQPGLSIPMVLYGPMLQRLYLRVRTQLNLQRGDLRVETSAPGALVFLSGRNAGVSPVTVKGVYQGPHDVLVIHGKRVSRVRRTDVGPRQAMVRFDLALDKALRTRDFAGLQLPEGTGRQAQESRLAWQIGSRLGADRVLLVGLQRVEGRRAITGRVFLVKRKVHVAKAYVIVDGAGPTLRALRRLARFLMYGVSPGQGVVVLRRRRSTVAVRVTSRRRPVTPLAIAGWSSLAVGLAVAAGGGIALGFDGTTATSAGGGQRRQVYTTASLGYGLLGAGLGVAAIGGVLLIIDHVRRRGRSPGTGASDHSLTPRVRFPVEGGVLLGLGGFF